MSRAVKTAASVAIAATLAIGVWWQQRPAPDVDRAQAVNALKIDSALTTNAGKQDTGSANPLAASSLRGTDIDGDVRFDAQGRLILDAQLRRFFDYHLSLIGESDLTQIRNLLRRALAARFDATRAETVLAHFERYTAYLQALTDAALAREPDPARRLAAVVRLRRERLGEAMAEAFFAEEEALAALSLQRRRIAQDPQIDLARKREALIALDRDAGYDARDSATLPEQAARRTAEIDRRTHDPARRYAERTATWGRDAADRLAALDAERNAWDTRLRRYATERDRILTDPRLDPPQRAQQIDALRTRMFAPHEQRRIASLEAIGHLESALSTHDAAWAKKAAKP